MICASLCWWLVGLVLPPWRKELGVSGVRQQAHRLAEQTAYGIDTPHHPPSYAGERIYEWSAADFAGSVEMMDELSTLRRNAGSRVISSFGFGRQVVARHVIGFGGGDVAPAGSRDAWKTSWSI